jgi:hypothetical protein
MLFHRELRTGFACCNQEETVMQNQLLLLWTVLGILIGQFVCFLFAAGYVLSMNTPDGKPSCRYKALLFGGIGFLLFGTNGLIVAPWTENFNQTRWVAVGLYFLGAVLLQFGLSQRRKFLSTRAKKPEHEGDR